MKAKVATLLNREPWVGEWVKSLFREIAEDPSQIASLIKEPNELFDRLIWEAKTAFSVSEDGKSITRIIDGTVFHLGEEVMDVYANRKLPIGLINPNGSIRLDIVSPVELPDGKFEITWRSVERIEKVKI